MTRTSQCSMQVIHIDLNFSQSYQCQCTRNKTLCITYYLLEIFVRYGKRKMKQRLRWAHFYRDRSAHWTNHNTDFFTVALENGNFFSLYLSIRNHDENWFDILKFNTFWRMINWSRILYRFSDHHIYFYGYKAFTFRVKMAIHKKTVWLKMSTLCLSFRAFDKFSSRTTFVATVRSHKKLDGTHTHTLVLCSFFYSNCTNSIAFSITHTHTVLNHKQCTNLCALTMLTKRKKENSTTRLLRIFFYVLSTIFCASILSNLQRNMK